MPAPRKTEMHPILMGLESHLHSRTIFRPPTAHNFGLCRAVLATTRCNCPARCPAEAGERSNDAVALWHDLTALTAVSDKEQLYADVVAFTNLTYCGRHLGKKTLVTGLARWKEELDELETEPHPASSSDDTVVSVFADTEEDVSLSSAAHDSDTESDSDIIETSLVRGEEVACKETFAAESDEETSGKDCSVAISMPLIAAPAEAMPVMAVAQPANKMPAGLEGEADLGVNSGFNYRAGPGLGDNEIAEKVPGESSNAGVAATTPPAEEPAESLIKFTFRGSVPDQQAFEEIVQSELLRIKSPDSLPEAPALVAEDALSPRDTADADDAISLPGSEASFEDFFEDAEETWVEDVASPVASVSVAAPRFHVPGAFPADDDDDDDVASPVTIVQQRASSDINVAEK